MSHTALGRLDLAALRAAAGNAEFAEAKVGLGSARGYPLAGADPRAPLARDLARSLTEAAFTPHHCATYNPLYLLGRVLAAFGYQVAPFGSGGAWLVTGRRTRGTGAEK